MPRVVAIEDGRVKRLATEIKADLTANGGQLVCDAAEVGDVDRWRRAARKAGRDLGVPVRTWAGRGLVAVSVECEVSEAEHREAAEIVANVIYAARPSNQEPL